MPIIHLTKQTPIGSRSYWTAILVSELCTLALRDAAKMLKINAPDTSSPLSYLPEPFPARNLYYHILE